MSVDSLPEIAAAASETENGSRTATPDDGTEGSQENEDEKIITNNTTPTLYATPKLRRASSDLSSSSSLYALSPLKELPAVISWAETLKSPSLAAFSPSEPASRHGLALQLAIERSKLLSKTSKRCLGLLTDLSSLYDQYATAVVKFGQGLPPSMSALQEAAISWSGETSKMSATLRISVTQPLMGYGTTHVDAVTGISQRYQQSRQDCATARQRALQARARYVRAAAPDSAAAGGFGVGEGAAKRVVFKQTDIRRLQEKYESLVKDENERVKQCQRLECMALETLQKMEEDRLVILVRGLVQALHAQKIALEETIVSFAKKEDDDEEGGAAVADGAKSNSKMFRFQRRSTDGDSSSGVMDAETLGLPVEMGELRDKVRASLEVKKERIQATKTLSLFLENIAKACNKLGSSIQQSLHKDNGSETLNVSMGSCEGARVLGLWDILVSFLETEAKDYVALAEQLRSLRGEKLDPIILNADRSIKAATESDDASWKQLCDAARAQARAEMRYRQSTAESAKARERIQSEGQVGTSTSTMVGVGQHFGKGLAKMFDILPDGGEKAMKILPTGARASYAQKSLEEADQREAKGRHHFDTAVEVAALALDAYKTNAESLLSNFGDDESSGWESIKETKKAISLQFQQCRQEHLDSLLGKQSTIQQLREDAFIDLNEWRTKAQQELVSRCVEKGNEESAPDSGFQLEVLLEKVNLPESEAVEDGNGSVDISNNDETFDDEDDLDEVPDEVEDELADMSENAKQGDFESAEESHMQKLFRRSFSAPPNLRSKLDLRGKFRRGRRGGSDRGDFETDLFLTYFWPEMVDTKKVSTIVDSFSCSFRDGGQKLPFQYGRVYLTKNRIIFTSWTKKKLNLYWPEVTHVKPSRGFHGLRNDTLNVICRKNEAGDFSCMTLGGFYDRAAVLEQIEKLREESRVAAEEQAAAEKAAETEKESPSVNNDGAFSDNKFNISEKSINDVVAPDEIIPTMTVVVSKIIHNISVQKFYEVVWAEKDKPLYRPWLEQSAFDINLDEWKEGKVVGSWCKEEYQFSRQARFKVKRTTHLYIGPPIANVVQTHRVRLEGNDKCIASMTIEFEGIPYSDCFAVEVRFVAIREGSDVKYECGLAVDFRKSTFLKRQIQAGTIEESTPVYRNFFKTVHAACVEARGGDTTDETQEEEVEEEQTSTEKTQEGLQSILDEVQRNSLVVGAICFLFLAVLIRRIFSSKSVPDPVEEISNIPFEMELIVGRIDKLEDQINHMQKTLEEVLRLLKERSE